MKRIALLYIGCCMLLLTACEEKMAEEEVLQIGLTPCQRQPPFITAAGFDPKRSALSTSEKKLKGLALVQFPLNPADTAGRKTWQHRSWKQFGYLSAIATDENGNVYSIPIPVVNELDNPREKQNTIYKVDATTGEMKSLVNLPLPPKGNDDNIFGLLGLFYDCHARLLYASTVAGSTRNEEVGTIYAIDPVNGAIIDKFTGKDAMGLCVAGVTGEKRLYFGSSRSSDIYSVKLTKKGKFSGSAQKEFTLDLMGPRGDDKARRIKLDKNGALIVYGVEFNYNLTAPTEKPETIYRFRYDEDEKIWLITE